MKLFSTSSSFSISNVLRQLLCFDATNISEKNKFNFHLLEENAVANKENNPGIVARLMGLDSMPKSHIEESTSSISDRRTMKNYAPSREEIGNYLFTPHFLLEHEEKFIVISFEEKKKRNNEVSVRSKSRGKNRRKREKRDSSSVFENPDPKKEGAPIEVFCPNKNSNVSEYRGIDSSSKSSSCENDTNGMKRIKGLGSTMVEEQHSDFENSSPVSVLDDAQFYTDSRSVAKSGGESVTLGNLNPIRKLPIELRTCGESPLVNPIIDLEKRTTIHNAESRQKDSSTDNFAWILDEICKMAQEDVIESNTAYIKEWKLGDITDICEEFELQIIGILLDELVVQLIDISHLNIL